MRLRLPRWQKPAWLDYVLRAAAVEPRVALGLGIGGTIAAVIFLFFTVAALFSGSIGNFIIGFFILAPVLAIGLPLPIAFLIAMPKLWMRIWTVTNPDSGGYLGIIEEFVNPAERLNYGDEYRWYERGQLRIVRTLYLAIHEEREDLLIQRPMPSSRERELYSDIDVFNNKDTRADEQFFEPSKTNLLPKLNVALVVVLICVMSFFGFALATDPGNSMEDPPEQSGQQEEVSDAR